MKNFTLYLGRGRGNLEPVSKARFYQFLQEEVNPRLTQGYTVTSAIGAFKGTFKDTFVLSVTGAEEYEPAVFKIAEDYAGRFGQESVLVTSSPVSSFALVGPERTMTLPVMAGAVSKTETLQ